MSNWKEKIKQGDIAEACRRAGVSTTVYHNSGKIKPDNWTAGMGRVNMELKKIIDELAQQWINVEDELPKDTRNVLVKNDRFIISVGWYLEIYKVWAVKEYENVNKDFGTVTHWRYINLN